MVQSVTLLENQAFISVDQLLTNERRTLPNITFGIEAFDNALPLSFGQFAAFQGIPAHDLCMRLCARATLPQPLGPDCDVIFIDGGNNFDPYAISNNSIEHGLDPVNVLERLHVSRAFTHHQLACIVIDKLQSAIEKFKAKLIIVSDITQLYCDPDVREDDEDDSLRIFRKTVGTLRMLARRHRCLILTTNRERRNLEMNRSLVCAAHVSVRIEQKPGLTRFFLLKHPCLSPRTTTAFDSKVLESYM
jgi:hypothetical protein